MLKPLNKTEYYLIFIFREHLRNIYRHAFSSSDTCMGEEEYFFPVSF